MNRSANRSPRPDLRRKTKEGELSGNFGVQEGWIVCQRNYDVYEAEEAGKLGKKCKYKGTVLGRRFVVPFRHCLGRSEQAILGLCGQGSC